MLYVFGIYSSLGVLARCMDGFRPLRGDTHACTGGIACSFFSDAGGIYDALSAEIACTSALMLPLFPLKMFSLQSLFIV